MIAIIQSFGDRINFHPHLHFLVSEGGVDEAGTFHPLTRFNDERIGEVFSREVLAMLLAKDLLSMEWAQRLLSWRQTGFSVHSEVRAKTKEEAERIGKYMIRPLLSLERLSFDEKEGKVGYGYGKEAQELETMDFSVVDRIIDHLKLMFVADKPPPPQVVDQELPMAAETSTEYVS